MRREYLMQKNRDHCLHWWENGSVGFCGCPKSSPTAQGQRSERYQKKDGRGKTAKRFPNIAQGRAAHPGNRQHKHHSQPRRGCPTKRAWSIKMFMLRESLIPSRESSTVSGIPMVCAFLGNPFGVDIILYSLSQGALRDPGLCWETTSWFSHVRLFLFTALHSRGGTFDRLNSQMPTTNSFVVIVSRS